LKAAYGFTVTSNDDADDNSAAEINKDAADPKLHLAKIGATNFSVAASNLRFGTLTQSRS
jgi:hypothetical protein